MIWFIYHVSDLNIEKGRKYMSKTILAIGITILFIGMSFNSISGIQIDKKTVILTSRGNTLYVGGNGPGNYTKIQDAINNANNGDTIYVYDDSAPYHEIINIDKSINLIGEDKNTTIIDNHKLGNIINIIKDGVTIESFTLTNASDIYGKPVFGIKVESNNNEIKNTIISNNWWGISCENYYNNRYIDNIIKKNNYGIYIDGGENNLISNNKFISNKAVHLRVYDSDLNIINNNLLKNGSKYGIYFRYAININLTDNILENCGINFGASFTNFSNNIINGKPFIYLLKESNKIIEEAGQIYLKNCNNITIKKLDLSNVSFSIFGSENSKIFIEDNIFYNTYNAIIIESSTNYIFKNNYIKNSADGIRLSSSKDCIIRDNYIYNGDWIDLYGCTSISIVNNTLIKGGWNIYLQYSDYCNISNNLISQFQYGIYIEIDSKNNTISKNDIYGCNRGIKIEGFSDDNLIFNNNFIDNQINADLSECKNSWKLNYWDDYLGEDNDGDGIGDIPYVINNLNMDNYPLMEPYNNYSPDAPIVPEIDGPTNGKPGEEYDYTFLTTDPDGDDVFYYINWGDGTFENWMGPYASGEMLTLKHSWNKKDKYIIIARAKDSNGLIGPWGELSVTMRRDKSISSSPLLRFLERYPLIKYILQRFEL